MGCYSRTCRPQTPCFNQPSQALFDYDHNSDDDWEEEEEGEDIGSDKEEDKEDKEDEKEEEDEEDGFCVPHG